MAKMAHPNHDTPPVVVISDYEDKHVTIVVQNERASVGLRFMDPAELLNFAWSLVQDGARVWPDSECPFWLLRNDEK